MVWWYWAFAHLQTEHWMLQVQTLLPASDMPFFVASTEDLVLVAACKLASMFTIIENQLIVVEAHFGKKHQ